MTARLGVYKSWPTFKKVNSKASAYAISSAEQNNPILQEYGLSGRFHVPEDHFALKGVPSMERVHRYLFGYGYALSGLAQIEASQGRRYEELCAKSFVAMKVHLMVSVLIHERFPRRFEGRKLQKMSLSDSMLVALALALGDESEGRRLGRVMVESYRRDYYFDKDEYPIFHFILRLFCDWSGEAPPVWEEKPLREPIMDALFLNWREVDVERLAPYILAACDYHTHRCRANSSREFYEFSNGDWVRFPLEILMLYRLREWLGLENPEIDHPLMDGALGRLPLATPLVPDELTACVLSQMKKEGYNEEDIYRSLCLN